MHVSASAYAHCRYRICEPQAPQRYDIPRQSTWMHLRLSDRWRHWAQIRRWVATLWNNIAARATHRPGLRRGSCGLRRSSSSKSDSMLHQKWMPWAELIIHLGVDKIEGFVNALGDFVRVNIAVCKKGGDKPLYKALASCCSKMLMVAVETSCFDGSCEDVLRTIFHVSLTR